MKTDVFMTREHYQLADDGASRESPPQPSHHAQPEGVEPCPLDGAELSAVVAEVMG